MVLKKKNILPQKGLIDSKVLESIQDSLIQSHAELIVKGLLDPKARQELKYYVAKDHGYAVKGNEEIVEYIVQETVGTGVIEEIIKDETVTDIGYNGTDLIIESNDIKKKYTGDIEITDDYIVRIIQKFANAVGKDFTPKQPILDAVFENIRVNAVNKSISPYGTTMSLRISRPKLVLNEKTFNTFAPGFMYDFFKAVVQAKSNIVIGGETGTGKTELQKLLISFIPFEQKITMIEDVQESHIKEMFPEKDIISWVTSGGVTYTNLIAAALRNNPRWIMISETRGEEAYEMIQAVLSGHKIITTVHSINARAIPKRLINMAKIGYSVSEDSLQEDIRRNFDFGVQIKRINYEGKVIRYLSEVVEFNEKKDNTVFEQRFIDGTFYYKVGDLSDEYKDRFLESGACITLPSGKEFTKSLK
ncbi:pilus assembly protein CpaF [Alkalibaculum bacchi]|uniref:Pilus assembly protein CpaF n=1 Tax=Alkalibaculum bacchi TaxID=645887 RepID=A0A366I130_9FIRM|nr:CpaF/VirB11 family protein [Alkalibaculum bacchi]RBP59285.1 pilus assembly protein CpaF [Alkalibaculum bacchi]